MLIRYNPVYIRFSNDADIIMIITMIELMLDKIQVMKSLINEI